MMPTDLKTLTPERLLTIEKPIYGGAFLARDEGKAIFVPLTLPGEQARVRVVEDKRSHAIAEAEDSERMALAMKLAVEAGRAAFLAGRMPRREYAVASSPLAGKIGAAV